MSKIIISGASGNLGIAVTKRLLKDNHFLLAVAGKDDTGELPVHEKLKISEVDLTDESKAQHFIEKSLEEYPGIRTAILLVGGFAMGKLTDTYKADINRMIELNFFTAYHIVRPLLSHFIKHKKEGQFILVGSRPGLDAAAGKDFFAYSLSKAMVFKLAEFINAEGKDKGISATVIVPSTIDTEANRKAMPGADFSKWVPAENIADAISFSLSETGAMLRESVIKIYNKS